MGTSIKFIGIGIFTTSLSIQDDKNFNIGKIIYRLLINILTVSRVTHVCLLFSNGTDVYKLEALVTDGVTFNKVNDDDVMILASKDGVTNTEINEDELTFIADTLGNKYSIYDAVLSFFTISFINDDRWICSEHVLSYIMIRDKINKGGSMTPINLTIQLLNIGYSLNKVAGLELKKMV